MAPAPGVTGYDRGDLTWIADQDNLSAERPETAQVGKRHLPTFVDDTDVGCVLALVDPEPSSRGRHHDAAPGAEPGNTLQVGSLSVEALGTLRLACTQESYARTDPGCAIGHVERLRTSLRRNRDLQACTPMQLFGEMNHEAGFASAWW
jgi:hypothetical protein